MLINNLLEHGLPECILTTKMIKLQLIKIYKVLLTPLVNANLQLVFVQANLYLVYKNTTQLLLLLLTLSETK